MINAKAIQLTMLQENEEATLAPSVFINWNLRSGTIYWKLL